MAYFRITHLAGRKSYRFSAGFDGDKRISGKEVIEDRCVGGSNSVAVCLLPDPETVEDHKHRWSVFHIMSPYCIAFADRKGILYDRRIIPNDIVTNKCDKMKK